MKTFPGSALEVIKPKLFFQPLMRMFANPLCLDGAGWCAQICRGGQTSDQYFTDARLADEPGFVAWQMLLTLIPSADEARRKCAQGQQQIGFQPTFGPLRRPNNFQLALASMSSSVAIDRISATCCLRV